MAVVKYNGSGAVATTDYKDVKWVGKTKSGHAVTITVKNAICISNIDLTIAEKDDIVPKIEFEGCYTEGSTAEPWEMEIADGVTAGTGEIVLGVGLFYIGNAVVGLTRGGGSFAREVELREINADGDMGKVQGRVHLEGARPKLTMNMLQWLTRVDDIYVGITKT